MRILFGIIGLLFGFAGTACVLFASTGIGQTTCMVAVVVGAVSLVGAALLESMQKQEKQLDAILRALTDLRPRNTGA